MKLMLKAIQMSCVTDTSVDIALVKYFLTEDGYTALYAMYSSLTSHPSKCQSCKQNLDNDQSVWCKSCLNGFSFQSAQLKTTPKSKY